MFINDLTTSDSMPVLEATLRFSAQRQRLIANNIANISTPDYRMMDVSVDGFRKTLAEAVEKRRARTGGMNGDLDWQETRQLRRDGRGGMTLVPREMGDNILFHDRGNRDVERLMQTMVENTAAHRVAADLLRGQFDLLRSAISERS